MGCCGRVRLALICILFAALAACERKGSGAAAAEPARPALPTPAASTQPDVENIAPETILVRLDDVDKITQGDFERHAGGARPYQYDYGITTLVHNHELLLYAKDHPDLVTAKQVEDFIRKRLKPGQTLEQYEEQLKKAGRTLDEQRRL